MDQIKKDRNEAIPVNSNSNTWIINLCNNKGGWGSTVHTKISKIWNSIPEKYYREWVAKGKDYETLFGLSQVQFVTVVVDQAGKQVVVCNCIVFDGFDNEINCSKIFNKHSFKSCILKVRDEINDCQQQYSIQIPLTSIPVDFRQELIDWTLSQKLNIFFIQNDESNYNQ